MEVTQAGNVVELDMQNERLADSTDANQAADSNGPAVARSQSWHLELPRMNLAFLQMSSVANAEWDSIIASKGLHFSVSQYVTLQHQITDKSPRLQLCPPSADAYQWL